MVVALANQKKNSEKLKDEKDSNKFPPLRGLDCLQLTYPQGINVQSSNLRSSPRSNHLGRPQVQFYEVSKPHEPFKVCLNERGIRIQ